MTLARELIEAMGNSVPSEGIHGLNRQRLLRALRTLAERGPSEGMKRAANDAFPEPPIQMTCGDLGASLFGAMLVELIREIEEER